MVLPLRSLGGLRLIKAYSHSRGGRLMLRQPGSLYVEKRSMTLLKVKTFLEGDAQVIGYEAGKVRSND